MLGLHRASRSRFAVGSVAVASMTVLGLGVTASGTQAAETVRAGVERATGVDIAALAPVAQEAVAATPAPVATPETRKHRVVIVKDGKTRTYEGAEADAYIAANPPPMPPLPPVPPAPGVAPRAPLPPLPPMPPHAPGAYAMNIPEIASRDCRPSDGGGEKQVVIHRAKGSKRMMIICTNRIEKMAAESAELAANSRDIQRQALESALAGLRSARASIAANPNMDEAQRREALAGIDEGMAEVQADMANPD